LIEEREKWLMEAELEKMKRKERKEPPQKIIVRGV
jgi:hypothetical protein